MLPNYTPADWWENDVIRVTQAGYWYEYEIKLSLNDFYADRRKEHSPWGKPIESKHRLLAGTDGRGPRKFWFVCPWFNVIQMKHVPEWAGLIWAYPDGHESIKFKVIRNAPSRKSEKRDFKFINGVNATGCRRLVYELTQGRLQTITEKGELK